MQPALYPPIDPKVVSKYRHVADLTTRQLGQRAGLSPSMVSRIEGGSRTPSPRVTIALADALGVGVVDLLDREGTALWAAGVLVSLPARTVGASFSESPCPGNRAS